MRDREYGGDVDAEVMEIVPPEAEVVVSPEYNEDQRNVAFAVTQLLLGSPVPGQEADNDRRKGNIARDALFLAREARIPLPEALPFADKVVLSVQYARAVGNETDPPEMLAAVAQARLEFLGVEPSVIPPDTMVNVVRFYTVLAVRADGRINLEGASLQEKMDQIVEGALNADAGDPGGYEITLEAILAQIGFTEKPKKKKGRMQTPWEACGVLIRACVLVVLTRLAREISGAELRQTDAGPVVTVAARV